MLKRAENGFNFCTRLNLRELTGKKARHLKELLYHVYINRDEARDKGICASKEVRCKWTWDEAARKAASCLDARGLVSLHEI